jgi:hypothetical protein
MDKTLLLQGFLSGIKHSLQKGIYLMRRLTSLSDYLTEEVPDYKINTQSGTYLKVNFSL